MLFWFVASCARLIASLPIYVWLALLLWLILSLLFHLNVFMEQKTENPKLYHKDSGLWRSIIRRCPRMNQAFVPPFWARNPNIQTVLSLLFCRADVHFDSEFVQMPDGGLVSLEWANHGYDLHKSSPVLLVIPGINGDAVSVSHLCDYASRNGFRAVVFNRRGHGGCPLLNAQLQGYCDSSDLRQAMKYIRGKCPCTKIVAVGVSTGSALLLSYLSEFGSSSNLQAAVCISPEYNPLKLLKRGLPHLYEIYGLYYLKKWMMAHALALSKTLDMDKIMRSTSLYETENAVRGVDNETAESYWAENDPMQDIDEIAVPLLFISSKDDPIVPDDCIPYNLFDIIPNMILVRTEKGGHAGFLEGQNLEPWADKLSVDFLQAVLEVLRKQRKFTLKRFPHDVKCY